MTGIATLPSTHALAGVAPEELDKLATLADQLAPGSPLGVLLTHVLTAARKGLDVAVLAKDQQFTPNQAAQLLQVSRPHVLKLIERGLLEEESMAGSHHRISMSAIVSYIERRERARADVADAVASRAALENRAAAELAGIDLDELNQIRL